MQFSRPRTQHSLMRKMNHSYTYTLSMAASVYRMMERCAAHVYNVRYVMDRPRFSQVYTGLSKQHSQVTILLSQTISSLGASKFGKIGIIS